MKTFEDSLAAIIGRPSSQRPFVCNGFPGKCRIWVVGYNAATTGEDWWEHWSEKDGFDYAAWRRSYDEARATRGKGPSATRRRIDRISALVPALLETNIFAAPSTSMANMPQSTTAAFDLLLSTFKPEVIIAHGVPAKAHLSDWSGGKLIATRHLSRVGYAEVDIATEQALTHLG